MSIDAMFGLLATGPTWASILLGFFLVLTVVFMGVAAFGRNRVELGAFGFMVLILIGTILATVVGLFPYYIILIFLIISLVSIIFGKMLGGSNQ